MSSSPIENKELLLNSLIKHGAIDSKNARAIAVPQNDNDIIELVAAKVDPEALSVSLAETCGYQVMDLVNLEHVNFSDSEKVIRGGEGLNLWMIADDVIFITNPFNQGLVTAASDAYDNREDIKDVQVLPLSFTKTELWKRTENTQEIIDSDFVDPEAQAQAERMLDSLVKKAIENCASDIHFVPNYRNEVDVKMRIDGSVIPMDTYDLTLHQSLCIILMDERCEVAYQKNVEQDGRFSITRDGKDISFRVATIPQKVRGKRQTKITIRILNGDDNLVHLTQLGMSSTNLGLLSDGFKQPQGLILVTGPTGSGKSTTLYGGMRYVYDMFPEKMFYTLEDPVEQEVDEFVQVECNKYLQFSNALRNMLRQDPDVMMVGEIRDSETAQIAVEASMTGHLICSTLHTKNSHETVGRVRDFGITASVLAEAVLAIVSQRLVKKLCKHCRVPVSAEEAKNRYTEYFEELSTFYSADEEVSFYRANVDGCEHCNGGYSGRTQVMEVLPMDEELEDMIFNNVTPKEARRTQIQSGSFKDMWHDALRRVAAGQTSIETCNRTLDSYRKFTNSAKKKSKSKNESKKLKLFT